MGRQSESALRSIYTCRQNLIIWSRKGQRNTMAELLTGALPQAANKLDQEWDEEQVYELGDLCPSENEKKSIQVTS